MYFIEKSSGLIIQPDELPQERSINNSIGWLVLTNENKLLFLYTSTFAAAPDAISGVECKDVTSQYETIKH